MKQSDVLVSPGQRWQYARGRREIVRVVQALDYYGATAHFVTICGSNGRERVIQRWHLVSHYELLGDEK